MATDTAKPKTKKTKVEGLKHDSKPASEGLPAEGGTTATSDTDAGTGPSSPHTAEAKSRFSAALDEAKAGAAALGAEAKERAGSYRTQAKSKSGDWTNEAKTTSRNLATEGKAKASEVLSGLSRTISDTAPSIDERFGAQYGDYARSASQRVQASADSLNQKSIDELGEDAREFVRKSPGTALGIAAVVGYFVARLFRR